MNDSCGYLPNTLEKFDLNPQKVQLCYDKLVNLIDAAFSINTQLTKAPIPRTIKDPTTEKTILTISEPTLIKEISSYDMAQVFDDYDGITPGFYDLPSGVIFLDENKWCLSTLAHETLHSRSIFSQTKLPDNYNFIVEGITELFVGLTFQRNALNDCFSRWQTIDDCFHDKYEEYVKPWHFLYLKFKDLKAIEQLYFNQQIQNPLQQLGVLLEAKGCIGCQDLLTEVTDSNTIFQGFKDILGKNFPEQFADFMRSDLRYTINLTEL